MTFATVTTFLILTYLLSYLALRPLFNDWTFPEWQKPRHNRPGHWEERFGVLRDWWNYIFLGSGLLGLLSASIAHAKLATANPNSWFPELMFGIVGFFFGIMGTTDFFTQKAPLDVQDLAFAVIAPLGALGILFNVFPKNYPALYFGISPYASQLDDLYQFGPFFAIVLIFFLVWARGLPSIGFADIITLAIAAFALAPMIGLLAMFWALIAACVFQIIAFGLAQIFGWGIVRVSPYKPETRERWNKIWRRLTFGKFDLLPPQVRFLQWLPMLCLGYLVTALVVV